MTIPPILRRPRVLLGAMATLLVGVILVWFLLRTADRTRDLPDAIHVRITKEELQVDGVPLAPIVYDPKRGSLQFPDSIWAGLVLGSLIEAMAPDPRRTVLFEADSSTPGSLYLVALETIHSTGRGDLVFRMEGRKDLRLPLLDLEPSDRFVDLERMIDSAYVVLAWDSGGAFYDRRERLAGADESGRESILDEDSLASRLATPVRTPVRRSIVVSVAYLAPRFGKLHELLSVMDEALASRPKEERFPLLLNVEFWFTSRSFPLCGRSYRGARCGEASGRDSSIDRKSVEYERN